MPYKIVQNVYCKLHEKHVPYFGYSVVEGPRGGRYILDEYNTERLIQDIVERDAGIPAMYVRSMGLAAALGTLEVKRWFLNESVNDKWIREFANKNNMTLVQRTAGEKWRYKIKEGLKLSEKQIENFKKRIE